MSFNIACSAGAKVVIEGESLSLNALHRVLDLCNEYCAYMPITIAIHSTDSDPKNIIRYLPVRDFRFSEDYKHAALIDFDYAEDEDEDEDEEDDEDVEENDDDDDENTPRHKKLVFKLNIF